ncbi:MAG: hypothetical protein ACPGTS_02385, partial [Minisyncoccia bacterium]
NIKMLADPGANAGCVNSQWAYKHFKDYVRCNNQQSILLTGNGAVRPKYVLWMTFPTKSGKILRAQLFLVDNLPVDILADINMLIKFGYKFKNEIPPTFRHPASYEDNLDDLKDDESKFKVTKIKTPGIYQYLTNVRKGKMHSLAKEHAFQVQLNSHFITQAKCINKIIKDNSNYEESVIKDDTPDALDEEIVRGDPQLPHPTCLINTQTQSATFLGIKIRKSMY